MARIRLLSEHMIGKIAAGEVVERPAAAIKELVENSLDAGATSVTVEIREGGLDLIRVADNGSGIEEADLRMAFERHATSKISKEQDLFSIQTLGFRGEALASIAAVSHVTLTTRTASQETGLKVKNDGGVITEITEAACPTGTTVVVRDLFYNVPVRKGFMKKSSQEASAVTELMTQMLLSRPEVSFRYIVNGKTELHSPGDGQLASALHTIYGGTALKSMREVDGRGNGVLIKGYVGIGENARGNRNHEFFFINGRVMHSKLLSDALEAGCRERVMIGKFPICALHLTIAYESVDVNVHPNKLEVRFRDEQGVYDAVLSSVVEALKEPDAFTRPVEMQLTREQAAPPVRPAAAAVQVLDRLPDAANEAAGNVKPVPEVRPIPQAPARNIEPDLPAAAKPDLMPAAPETPVTQAPPAAAVRVPETPAPAKYPAKAAPPSVFFEERAEQVDIIRPEIRKTMKVFGALFDTFILVEYEDQLLLVDQHAVHERLLFDRLMKEQGGAERMGQELLVPMIISVTEQEQRLLEENREALESIGLVIEAFGQRDIAVRTIPMVLGEAETRDVVTEIIAQLESGKPGKDPSFEKKRSALLQTACKHAVKGGEPLTEDQLRSLLDTMIAEKVTPTCPHGRPLVVAISHRELDKKFKRIQQ